MDAYHAFKTTDPYIADALNKWVTARPDSAAARMARGEYYSHMSTVVGFAAPDAEDSKSPHRSWRQYLEAAADDYYKAVELQKTASIAYAALIYAESYLGRRKQADQAFLLAKRNVPQAIGPYISVAESVGPDMGGDLRRIGQVVDHWFRTATVAGKPVDLRWYALYRLGVHLHHHRNQPDLALAPLQQATGMTENSNVHAELASALWDAGRRDEALAALDKLVHEQASSYPAQYQYCRLLSASHRFAEARRRCEALRRLDPLNPDSLIVLANLEWKIAHPAFKDSGLVPNLAKVQEDFDLADLYGHFRPAVQRARAESYLGPGRENKEEAKRQEDVRIESAEMWARLDPQNEQAWAQLAHLHLLGQRCEYIQSSAVQMAICLKNKTCGPTKLSIRQHLVDGMRKLQGCEIEDPLSGDQMMSARSDVRTMTFEGLSLGMTKADLTRVVPTVEFSPRVLMDVVNHEYSNRAELADGWRLIVARIGLEGRLMNLVARTWVAPRDAPALLEALIKEYGPPDFENDRGLWYRQLDATGTIVAEVMFEFQGPDARFDPSGCGVPHFEVQMTMRDHELQKQSLALFNAAMKKHAAEHGISLTEAVAASRRRPPKTVSKKAATTCSTADHAQLERK